ncbi:hypothetical protein PoB_000602100 [Plakobranchus ocellatus]|uniref:Uncharacterized protein n=1 Tax=Plakobranchus ocellatus TaxID=259542 RepID=A0AAV3Y8H1_9GAST|nr:hypothetical protein PoB_000602100 [Plakobranchus ocellatus]
MLLIDLLPRNCIFRFISTTRCQSESVDVQRYKVSELGARRKLEQTAIMSGEMTQTNNSTVSYKNDPFAFHRDVLLAEKAYEKEEKAPGRYKSEWKTEVNDYKSRGSDGKVYTTRMSSNYDSKESSCTLL